MIKAENVSITVEGEPLFTGLDINVHQGDKVGLVGANGSGKTTLLRILARQGLPSSGSVWHSPEESVAIATHPEDPREPVGTFVGEGLGETYRVYQRIERLSQEISVATRGALEEYGELQDRFEQLIGWSALAKIDVSLAKVGLDDIDLDRALGSLSGGQLARAVMARMLVARPTTLLLDEPTNHLDATGIEWLTDYLKTKGEAVVLVSYDRELLDVVPHRIVEIDDLDGTADVYSGNYSTYLQRRAEKDRRRRQLVQAQESNRQRIEEYISCSKSRARALEGATRNPGIRAKAKGIARQAKARERRLQTLLESTHWLTDVPTRESRAWLVQKALQSAPAALRVDEVTVSLGGRSILQEVSLSIRPGDRVLVRGDNGSGKTTLLRILVGQLTPDSGQVESTATKVAMLPQSLDLPARVSPMAYFRREVGVYIEEAQVVLSNYLFDYESWTGPVERLSRGEQRRLQVAVTFNTAAGLTILDEPTNYLDFEGLDLLEGALSTLPGTVIVVTHDRYLARAFRPTLVCSIQDGRIAMTHRGA